MLTRLTLATLCAIPVCAFAQSTVAQPNVAALEARIKRLEQTVDRLQRGYWKHIIESNRASLMLEPTSQGFGYLETKDGGAKFAVSIEKVEAFADGVSVTLQITPLFSASYTGLKLDLEYGPRWPGEKATENTLSAWTDSLQRTTRSIPQRIVPGVWTSIDVRLPGIKQDSFGHLSLSIDAPTISPAT